MSAFVVPSSAIASRSLAFIDLLVFSTSSSCHINLLYKSNVGIQARSDPKSTLGASPSEHPRHEGGDQMVEKLLTCVHPSFHNSIPLNFSSLCAPLLVCGSSQWKFEESSCVLIWCVMRKPAGPPALASLRGLTRSNLSCCIRLHPPLHHVFLFQASCIEPLMSPFGIASVRVIRQ